MLGVLVAKERLAIAAGLAFASIAGLWLTLVTGDSLMQPGWRNASAAGYAFLLFLMWWSMMMAMMLPSTTQALLTYRTITRKLPGGSGWLFVSGYAAVWTGFSLAAVLLQILTRDVLPLTGMMAVISHTAGGILLIAAGLYQFTALKRACLKHCQTPLFYLMHHWRKGPAGAFRMGLSHGLYCLGCCWVLMGLLFYGGVMELHWIAGLAIYVAAEKLIPARFQFEKWAGIVLVAWGLGVLASALS